MFAPPNPDDPLLETKVEGKRAITCIDDHDPPRTWWLTEDSQVGDWLRYVEEGGTVEPYVAPEPEAQPKTTKRKGT
jgi:hypothetical protein